MTINMMILNTLIFALGLCGVRLSRARGGDIVSGTCSTTTGRHGAQPQLDEEKSLGVDSGCSCSSQGLEQQVSRTAAVPRPDVRDTAPASAAASSSPPCKNNASKSAVDTAANPRRSANDHEEPALPKGGEIIPPSPAKTAHAWVIDTGASCHVTGDRELLRDLRPSVLSEYLHLTGTACRTSTGSHPHLDAEAEPCGIDSGHSSSQSTGTGTAQQAMPAYACSTKDEYQMPVALTAPSSTQVGGGPEVVLDSGCSVHMTGSAKALQNPEHMPMDIDASSSTQAGGGPEVVLDSGCSVHMTGSAEALQNPEHMPMDIDLDLVLDSGASLHMTGCGEVLQNRKDMTGSVVGISGTPLSITEQGSIMGPIWLDEVHYVPDGKGLSTAVLVSVRQLTRALSARVIFEPDCCRVERMSDNCEIGCGTRDGYLYKLERLTSV